MKSRTVFLNTLALAVIAGLLVFQNCAPVGSTSDGSSSHSSSSVKGGGPVEGVGGTTTDNPKATVNVVISNAGGTVTDSAQLCLGAIQFSTADTRPPLDTHLPAHVWDNQNSQFANALLNFAKQLITGIGIAVDAVYQYTQSLLGQHFIVAPKDNFVETIPITPGTYSDVDLALDNTCSFGSLSLPTSTGAVVVHDPLIMHFKGNLNTRDANQVNLQVQNILAALSQARSPAEVKQILAKTSGAF